MIRSFSFITALILLFSCSTHQTLSTEDSYTLYLVRHCEKKNEKVIDPELTPSGHESASRLAAVLSTKEVLSIYSSDYKRTRDTAKPLAELRGLEVFIYNPRELHQIANTLKTTKKNSLIVGHSNTTPALANLILGTDVYEDFSEDQYNQILEISIAEDQVQHKLYSF